MLGVVQMGGQEVLIEYGNGEIEEDTMLECVATLIQAVLEKYEIVFQMP